GVDDPSNPWIQLFTKVWQAHGDGKPLTNYEVYGMSEAYTFVEALQLAGKNLTREGLVKALEKGGGKLQGPWFAPLRYSSSSHLGISGMKVVKLEGGKAVPVTPLEVTDMGNAPIKAGTAEAAPPPANGIPNVKPVS
ncbi:MAG: ABC transporter substrate-binding protein, partial [Nocardioides sp.]|nr:ABC transporter substrate-binding protein [Nocardioides sp.]